MGAAKIKTLTAASERMYPTIVPTRNAKLCKMKLGSRWAVAELKVKFTPTNKTGVIIHNSNDAYHIMLEMWDKTMIHLQEQFAALFCNRASEVIGYRLIGTGSGVATTIAVKELVGMAVACQATMVIIAHNHPSGTLHPSDQDRSVTMKLKLGLGLLDITLNDHLIIGPKNYFSFADENIL